MCKGRLPGPPHYGDECPLQHKLDEILVRAGALPPALRAPLHGHAAVGTAAHYYVSPLASTLLHFRPHLLATA